MNNSRSRKEVIIQKVSCKREENDLAINVIKLNGRTNNKIDENLLSQINSNSGDINDRQKL